jgi:hypothetical protein
MGKKEIRKGRREGERKKYSRSKVRNYKEVMLNFHYNDQ